MKSQTRPGAHDAGIEYGVLAADIAADNMAAHIAAEANAPGAPASGTAVMEVPEAANDMAVDEAMSSGDDEAETAGAEPAGAGASGASSPVAAANVTNAVVEESPPLQLIIQSDNCNQETKHARAGAAGVAATVTNPEVTNGAGNDLAAPVPPGDRH